MSGQVDGRLDCSARRWLRVDPRRLRGLDPTFRVFVDSARLREGQRHEAAITLRGRGLLLSLPVSLTLQPAKVGAGTVIAATFLTITTLIPALGLVPACLMMVLYLSSPLDARTALRVYLLCAIFLAVCNVAALALLEEMFHPFPGLYQHFHALFG